MVNSTSRLWAVGALVAAMAPRAAAAQEDDEPGGAKYPEYVVGGAISLAAAAGLAVGGAFAVGTDSPQTATGLLGLGTVAAGVGVPLLLLGASDEQPVSTFRMATGVAIATPGVICVGLAGTMWGTQEASGEELRLGLPLAMMIGGAVATVGGIILYATGAGHDDSADRPAVEATFSVGPAGATLVGRF